MQKPLNFLKCLEKNVDKILKELSDEKLIKLSSMLSQLQMEYTNDKEISNILYSLQDVIESVSRIRQYYKTTCRDYNMDNKDIFKVSKQHNQKRRVLMENRSKSCINKPSAYNFNSKSNINDVKKYYPMVFNDACGCLSIDEIENIGNNNNDTFNNRKSTTSINSNKKLSAYYYKRNNKRIYEDYSLFEEEEMDQKTRRRKPSFIAFRENKEIEEKIIKEEKIKKAKFDFCIESGINIDNISDTLLNVIIDKYNELLTNPDCLNEIKLNSNDKFVVKEIIKYLRKIEEDLERREEFYELLINIKQNRKLASSPPPPPPPLLESDENENDSLLLEQISDIISKEDNIDGDCNIKMKYNKNRIGRELLECFSYVFKY